MTSISSTGAYSQSNPVTPPAKVDRDGDNDDSKPKAAESATTSRGPAAIVSLSPAAQALVASQKS